eukprot:CAMPEP_0119470730 /NCGR_PEP_ID=MMETSP1344-20130328/3505_1 /TAXON_ID=236787 /ORGANISM="Florenciella parvula, Strain CCMP2471" /LENGTH=97 /DNA_ID=CAMNT_0007503435 /DNA_START=128 /DNA_END=419 /DNA_ORIENTATION=+
MAAVVVVSGLPPNVDVDARASLLAPIVRAGGGGTGTLPPFPSSTTPSIPQWHHATTRAGRGRFEGDPTTATLVFANDAAAKRAVACRPPTRDGRLRV